MVSATSNTSIYDNVASGKLKRNAYTYKTPCLIVFTSSSDTLRSTKSQETNTMTITTSVSTQNHVGSQVGQESVKQKSQDHEDTSKGTQAGGTLQNIHGHAKNQSHGPIPRARDYPEEMGHDMNLLSNSRRSKSKSTEDMNVGE